MIFPRATSAECKTGSRPPFKGGKIAENRCNLTASMEEWLIPDTHIFYFLEFNTPTPTLRELTYCR